MTRAEFIAKATEYGYDADGIKDLLSVFDEMKEAVPDADYADIILVEQPEY